MKQKFYILLLLLFSFYASFSQKTIRDYWDYKKTKIKEEVQMNAMGLGQGFYRSYYYRGGFKETGFFTNGKKTGLWSQYREGATKPWYQSNMIYGYGETGEGHQYKTMEKYWFENGPDAGKLKEWKEWDVSKYRKGGGAHFLEGEFLKVKHVVYINTWNDDGNVYPIKYMMRYDFDVRETLPLEKRYYKEYNKNGTFSSQWVFTKTGDKIETNYDENGLLTDKNTKDKNNNLIASPTYDEAVKYGSLGWLSYEKGDIDSCISYSKKAISIWDNLPFVKLNLGLCYLLKNDEVAAKNYYSEAISDTKKFNDKKFLRDNLQAGVDDLNNYLKKHKTLKGSQEMINLLEKEILNYQ